MTKVIRSGSLEQFNLQVVTSVNAIWNTCRGSLLAPPCAQWNRPVSVTVSLSVTDKVQSGRIFECCDLQITPHYVRALFPPPYDIVIKF